MSDAAAGERVTLERGLAGLAPLGERRSASHLVYEQVRQAVVSLELPPGTVIVRGALARRLGTSQTPVREALIRLQEERLIEVVPQSATRVSRIDMNSAREAHVLRLSVELELCGRLALEPPPCLGDELGSAIAAMRLAMGGESNAAFTAADEAFHGALFAAAEVSGLHDLIRSRSGHLDRLRRLHLPAPGKRAAILTDHEAIRAAILAGDPAAAQSQMRSHLLGTFGELSGLRVRAPHYFEPGGDEAAIDRNKGPGRGMSGQRPAP